MYFNSNPIWVKFLTGIRNYNHKQFKEVTPSCSTKTLPDSKEQFFWQFPRMASAPLEPPAKDGREPFLPCLLPVLSGLNGSHAPGGGGGGGGACVHGATRHQVVSVVCMGCAASQGTGVQICAVWSCSATWPGQSVQIQYTSNHNRYSIQVIITDTVY